MYPYILDKHREEYKKFNNEFEIDKYFKNYTTSYIKDNKNIPRNAFWLQLLLSFLFIATSSFEQVLMYAGITLIITTTMTVVSLFILRYKEPLLDRPYRVKGYPFTPLIYLIVNVWILYYSFQENQFESFIGIGIVTSSVLIHYIFTKRNILL